MTCSRLLMSALLCVSVLPALATATPTLARQYKQHYGYMPACNACHSQGGGSELNPYGKAFKDNGKQLASFARIAALDSDADGHGNDSEAKARANPGDKRSQPGKAGDWLDMTSLIPREVRARFPGVTTWLPQDAVLTPGDMAAAKAMGVTLRREDDNTIYIPLKDRRPVGTALIFPVVWQKKTFYLLMTTDRQLTVDHVSVLHANALPEAKKLTLYAGFSGKTAAQLPAGNPSSLDGVISTSVKSAATLLLVRLKGA